MEKTLQNSSGKIYYGMHFYPGVAQYNEPGKEPYRVYLNEDTLRKMDTTFQGKPIFVDHVQEVNSDLNQLRAEADGWVVESFYNAADGKHWCKFVIVSKEAEKAIQNGYRLSNAYIPQLNGRGGEWNGVPYQNEVIAGEYEHLAIVKNPRYEESVILTPDQFKVYNENKQIELKRISNSKKESRPMLSKLIFWNRKPVENATDLENTFVSLPKARKEMSILQLVNEMEEMYEKEEKREKENMADPKHMVKLHDGSMCNVGELVDKHKQLHEEFSTFKDAKMKNREEDSQTGLDMEPKEFDVEGDLHNEDKEDDKRAKKEAEDLVKHEEREIKEAKKQNSKSRAHFDALKNAHHNAPAPEIKYNSADMQVARGRSRYGSDK